MQRLFDPAGRRALDAVMGEQPLLAFDFDGTLSPIVARPKDARVPLSVSRRLARLAERLPVAVVTGRATEDARARLGFMPYAVIGNHGADGAAWAPSVQALTALEQLRGALRQDAQALKKAGVQFEDKGLSMALHYRVADDRVAALQHIQSLLQSPDPSLRVFGGKCVVNVMPADAPDKSDAVVDLLSRSGRHALVFVGDDENDEPVFQRAGEHWLTVRVGCDAPRSKAQFFVDGHADMVHLLEALIARSPDPADAGA